MRTETEEEGLVQVSLTCAGREGGGEVQAEGTATESCQTHVRVEIIAKSPETGKSDKVVKEDEGVPGDQGEAPPYGGEAGERAASGSPAGSSKSQQSSIEEWQAEIVDGLTEELNASRAKYLELFLSAITHLSHQEVAALNLNVFLFSLLTLGTPTLAEDERPAPPPLAPIGLFFGRPASRFEFFLAESGRVRGTLKPL